MLRTMRIQVVPLREAYAQSLLGLVIWGIAVAVLRPGWSPALLIFGPLVLYPLLFEMIDESGMRRFSLFAFLPAIASYGFPQGGIAGVLALPWLVFALGLFAYRMLEQIRTRDYSILVIKGYLMIGAVWLVLARLGEQPLGYEHAIVHATAVHFHYAGFVLPILALQWLRAAPGIRGRLLLLALLLGVPLVAAGITLSAFRIHWPELIAVWFFVAACAWFAIEQIEFAQGMTARKIRWLLLGSSMFLIIAMTLACLYATGNYWQLDWLDIRLMLRSHGPIQVFGFALPGVLGWMAIPPKDNGRQAP